MILLELGGKTRRLRFDLNALAALEDKLGKSISELQEFSISASSTRSMLWAALLHEQPELTEREVGSWVTGKNFQEVAEKVVQALIEEYGLDNGKRPTRAAKGRPPTGDKSSTVLVPPSA